MIGGEIRDIIHCSGHSAPLIDIIYDNGETTLLQAPEGIRVGDKIMHGEEAPVNPGNILPLKSIPEGTLIYNIEGAPGDGGKFVGAQELQQKF